ncbi:MAG: tRNA lysidine(34) synthetase TilS, partial [Christensenellaceae bacterium]|nr:tRNA lysidine(34) synthetase TilS [Christensenellaceae bacterium]
PGIGHLSMRPAEPVPVRDDPLSQVLDAAALTGAVLRTRRPGDRMRMLGAPGGRLLSDVMIDRKIDRPLRDWMAVVARGNEVLWLPGAAIAQGVEISKDTEGACRLTWTREDLNDGNAPLDR